MLTTANKASWLPNAASDEEECLLTINYKLILRWSVAWKRNQTNKMTTVIAKTVKPARRFSNQTNTSPIKAVRKGRNMYIGEF